MLVVGASLGFLLGDNDIDIVGGILGFNDGSSEGKEAGSVLILGLLLIRSDGFIDSEG